MVTTHDNDHHLVQGSRQAYHWSSAPPPVTPPWSRHAALAALPGDTCPQRPLASVHRSRHYVRNQTWRTTHVACWSLSQHHVRQSNLQDNKHGFRASITSVCVQSYLWCDTNMAAVLLCWSNVWGAESALSQTAVKAQMVMPCEVQPSHAHVLIACTNLATMAHLSCCYITCYGMSAFRNIRFWGFAFLISIKVHVRKTKGTPCCLSQ